MSSSSPAADSSAASAPAATPEQSIIAIVQLALVDGNIGLYPTQNPGGADYYTCSFCGQTTDVQGHIGGSATLSEGRHRPDCTGMQLLNLAQSIPPAE
ncbi:MAG: hypothetical protein K2W82_15735 [Candidatus Obscuribacterales bacterium]|nr:hypothetical protein [Candidatus Obscuribacterales bacterium]